MDKSINKMPLNTTPGTVLLFLCTVTVLLGHTADARYLRDSSDKTVVNASTLRLVHILHRHGDRSPTRSYKNDIYSESDWPQGYGQLSKVGMAQTHELGVYLRQRYIDTGFLNPEYKRTQVYSRSTDYDRTLMSAYCVLAGMFPPDKNQTWDLSIAWQPIPVHTAPLNNDPLLYVQCPAYSKKVTLEKPASNHLAKETMIKYKDEFKYISEHSGEPNNWTGIGGVTDPIFCQYMSNYTLPDWVGNHTLTTLLQLRDIYVHVAAMTQEKYAYMVYGTLLGEIIDHMVNVTSGENTLSTKFFEYSAHDSNVQGLLVTMGLFNNRQPPYRSCVIIELHEPVIGQFVVKVLYRNESDHDPYPLKLKYCDLLCPLEKFRQIMKSSIPVHVDELCGKAATSTLIPSFVKSGPVAVIAGVLTIILLLCIVIGGFLCCRHRNKLRESHDYSPVPLEMS